MYNFSDFFRCCLCRVTVCTPAQCSLPFRTVTAPCLNVFALSLCLACILQLKCDGTRWRREGKWRGSWRMEWVASTLHTTSEHGVSSINTITTADAHTSAASSWLNWCPRRFKWTRPFRRKTKSGFCACAITFQVASTTHSWAGNGLHPSEWPWCLWKRAGETLNVIEIFTEPYCSTEHTLGSAGLSERFGIFTC